MLTVFDGSREEDGRSAYGRPSQPLSPLGLRASRKHESRSVKMRAVFIGRSFPLAYSSRDFIARGDNFQAPLSLKSGWLGVLAARIEQWSFLQARIYLCIPIRREYIYFLKKFVSRTRDIKITKKIRKMIHSHPKCN